MDKWGFGEAVVQLEHRGWDESQHWATEPNPMTCTWCPTTSEIASYLADVCFCMCVCVAFVHLCAQMTIDHIASLGYYMIETHSGRCMAEQIQLHWTQWCYVV